MSNKPMVLKFDDTEFLDKHDKNLNSNIISRILAYTYGEERTAEQIAMFLHMHIIKTQYYLKHLVERGLLSENTHMVIDGVVNKTYKLINNVDTIIKVDSEEKLAVEAKYFSQMLEDIVVSMKEDRCCLVHATGVLIDEEHAKIALEKIKELHVLLEDFEKECAEKPNLKQYNLITAYGQIL